MVGGGVETTGGRDEFASHTHTHDHLAPSFIIIAGGMDDIFDGAGGGTLAEKAQDGLTVRRTDGASREASEMRERALAQPVEDGNTVVGDDKFIGKDVRGSAKGVLAGEQQVLVLIGRVGSQQEAAASRSADGRGRSLSAHRVGRCLTKGRGEQDGTTAALGQLDEVEK